MASGWAQLPDDLLDNVAQRTLGIKDYVRLRAVCKSWRSFLRPRSRPPWLMLPYDPCSESCVRGFLDVSDGTVHEIDLPDTRGKRCCGSLHGWLVLERWPDVWLLNPAKRERVQLPSLTRRGEALAPSRFMKRGARERWEDCAYRSLRRPLFQPEVRRAALSSDPSIDGECTVVVPRRRGGGGVLQTDGRVVDASRVPGGSLRPRGRGMPERRVPPRQPLRARSGVRPRLSAARGAHAPGKAPRPAAHVGRPVSRPARWWL
uniref:Uncharacterized protein n=1 Tax=Oryza brachyantha TaxID=4533 RepID=J3M0Q6_ORYBR